MLKYLTDKIHSVKMETKRIVYDRDFDQEIDRILNDPDLNLGKGLRCYYLTKLLFELKWKLGLKTYDPN